MNPSDPVRLSFGARAWKFSGRAFLAALCMAIGSLHAQAPSRTMAIQSLPQIGATSTLLYQYPASAAGALGLHLITLSRGGAEPLAPAGFTSLGLSRIDANAILVSIVAPLDASGVFALPLAIPNDTRFLGFPFDAQALDVDFAALEIRWAANDLELVIGCPGCERPVVEEFVDESRFDFAASSGPWINGPSYVQLGGTGTHGSFDYRQGALQADGAYLFSTDLHVIPVTESLSGNSVTITDGKFAFTDFVVPAGVVVRFVGTAALQITVRGIVDIQGRVECNGEDQTNFNCRNTQLAVPFNPVAGQPGTLGGPGGARGGKGGDRCFGFGAAPQHNGENGLDILVGGAHAYAARAFQTGGRGSPIHPSHGLDASLISPVNTYLSGGIFNSNVNYGGGGGGYLLAGGAAQNLPTIPSVVQILPAAPTIGGASFNPFPKPAATSSRSHFLIGGSGGGGGGSHPFLGLSVNVTTFTADRWKAGGGGTGGGGAVSIRSGREVRIGGGGVVQARGGNGARISGDSPITATQDPVSWSTGPHWGIPAPGGGGSGGTILLQSLGDILIQGQLDASGGRGSYTAGILPNGLTTSLAIDNRGGDGSPGLFVLEAGGQVQTGSAAHVPAYNPAQNLGALSDADLQSGVRSTWRKVEFSGAPQWLRYVLELDLNGDGVTDSIYSDDISVPSSLGPAADLASGPCVVRFQGAHLDLEGRPIPGSVTPWRYVMRATGPSTFPGLDADQPTAFRFDVVCNRTFFRMKVKKLSVFVRG